MRLVLKWWAVLLTVVTLLAAPAAELFHCEDEDPGCCAAECSCVCHVEVGSVSSAQTGLVFSSDAGHLLALSSLIVGTLLPADIFRPPIGT